MDDYNSDISSMFQGVYKLDVFCFGAKAVKPNTKGFKVLKVKAEEDMYG